MVAVHSVQLHIKVIMEEQQAQVVVLEVEVEQAMPEVQEVPGQ